MDKTYVKLLELDERDAFHSTNNINIDFSVLIGRVFEVEDIIRDGEWDMFSGKLVGDALGSWDDGYYIFAYAKVEEVSNPTLM